MRHRKIRWRVGSTSLPESAAIASNSQFALGQKVICFQPRGEEMAENQTRTLIRHSRLSHGVCEFPTMAFLQQLGAWSLESLGSRSRDVHRPPRPLHPFAPSSNYCITSPFLHAARIAYACTVSVTASILFYLILVACAVPSAMPSFQLVDFPIIQQQTNRMSDSHLTITVYDAPRPLY